MWFRVYDKPITIQGLDEETESWVDIYHVHSCINSTPNKEYTNSGATRSQTTLTFELRYFQGLKDIMHNLQHYQIIYEGQRYNIVSYDNYMMGNQTIKFVGVTY